MTDVSDRPHKSRTPPSRDTPVVRSVALSLAGQVLVTRQIVGGDVSRLISNRPVQARDETIIRFREIMASRSPKRELRGKRALLRQTRPLDFRSGTDSEEHSSGAVSRRPPTQKVRINATRLFVNEAHGSLHVSSQADRTALQEDERFGGRSGADTTGRPLVGGRSDRILP